MKNLKTKLQVETVAKAVGKQISQVRNKKGLTQGEMGLLMDSSRQYMNEIERGEANISLKTLGEIAERLGCKVEIKPRKIREKKVIGQSECQAAKLI